MENTSVGGLGDGWWTSLRDDVEWGECYLVLYADIDGMRGGVGVVIVLGVDGRG